MVQRREEVVHGAHDRLERLEARRPAGERGETIERFAVGGEHLAEGPQALQEDASEAVVAQQNTVVGRTSENLQSGFHLVRVSNLLLVVPHALDPLRC